LSSSIQISFKIAKRVVAIILNESLARLSKFSNQEMELDAAVSYSTIGESLNRRRDSANQAELMVVFEPKMSMSRDAISKANSAGDLDSEPSSSKLFKNPCTSF
jgi:hypothetical protein